MLSKDAIKEFQEIYFTEYGEALSFEEAAARAERLLRLYKTVLKPCPTPQPNSRSHHNGNPRI